MEIKCDLVLLSWNNLPILKDCVDSIMRNTRTPSRLIVVDNGSTEKGIKEYLLSMKGSPGIEVKVIFNPTNEGFARGMNKGLSFSNAPYACILNNDIIVTDGWLEEMIKIAQENRELGIINPSSNNFGLRFGKGTTLDEFAGMFKRQTGRWVEMNACVGFCMLIKREVVTKIGYLNDEYGYAYFEDTDYSRRAQQAGYICAMAKGCYVYHAEGKSGKFLKDKNVTFDKSAEIFNSKWGRILRVVYLVSRKDIAMSDRVVRSIIGELKRHNRVWLFEEGGHGLKGLPEHLDLMRNSLPKKAFKLAAFWNIIKKKKKYDRVYVNDPTLRVLLVLYRIFRKATILSL